MPMIAMMRFIPDRFSFPPGMFFSSFFSSRSGSIIFSGSFTGSDSLFASCSGWFSDFAEEAEPVRPEPVEERELSFEPV